MATPLQPGDPASIGGYRLLSRLGAGGMGTVYLAEDVTRAQVAVKVIKAELVRQENAAALARFRREIAALRRLTRRCTAALLDADPEADPPYLVVEYVEGPSLSEAVGNRGPLTGPALSEVAVGAAVALEHIHAEGIAHRDLKPGNVLLGPHGPRVIDFGIALLAAGTQITATGHLVGTPSYMAPEQLLGERVTSAVDLFAWAGTVVYAASGDPPFGIDRRTVHTRILHGEPSLDGLDGPVLDMVHKALAKDPAARPSAAEVVDALRDLSRTVLNNASLGVDLGRLFADDAEGWAQKAGQNIAEGKTQLALYQAQRGLAMNPLHPGCLFRRAQANLAEGGHGLQDLQLAHEVDPEDPEIRRAYARELVARGGRHDVEKAHALNPDDAAVALAYARSLARRGQVERAFAIAPEDPEVRRRFALRLTDGLSPEGVLKALELSPGDPEVTSRYREFAWHAAGSTDIAPDVLRAVLSLTTELKPTVDEDTGPAGLDLARVRHALIALGGLDARLPAATRGHLAPLVEEALREEALKNTGAAYSLHRGAEIERAAGLAGFLDTRHGAFSQPVRDAYGHLSARTANLAYRRGCFAIVVLYATLALAWLGWGKALLPLLLGWLAWRFLFPGGLRAAYSVRREMRRRKAQALYGPRLDS